jgi:RecA-family ATPase
VSDVARPSIWAKQPIEQFPTFTPAAWQDKPIPGQDWLVDGLVSAGTVMMMSGDGGLGKSLLVQQLMTAAALGRQWLGFGTKPVRTWGMFCEDPVAELHRRQARINAHYDCDMSDLGESMMISCRIDHTSYMCQFAKWEDDPKPTALFDQMTHSVLEFGAQIVVLDTVRKTFGGNEIRDRQVAGYIRMLRRLAMQINGCVIVTAHPSNDGVASGSGIAGSRAWNNEVRSRMYLTREKKDDGTDKRTLKTMKSNYSKSGGKIEIVWEHGVFKPVEAPVSRAWSEPPLSWE